MKIKHLHVLAAYTWTFKGTQIVFLLLIVFLQPQIPEDVGTIQLGDIKKTPPNKGPSSSQTQHSIIPVT